MNPTSKEIEEIKQEILVLQKRLELVEERAKLNDMTKNKNTTRWYYPPYSENYTYTKSTSNPSTWPKAPVAAERKTNHTTIDNLTGDTINFNLNDNMNRTYYSNFKGGVSFD